MNYWFFYLLSTGKIYASPYFGDVAPLNIPNGCGIIGPFDQNSASFEIVDAFLNPNKYIVQNGQLVKQDNANDIILQNAITAKITYLDAQCNQTILNGFTSNALGQSHQYGFNYDDQQNLSGRLSLINTNPNYSQPFPWKTKDSGPLLHTLQEFIQVCTDSDIFKDKLILKYWTKKNQANVCVSLDQLATIEWNSTNPPSVPTGLTVVTQTTATTPVTPVTPTTPVYGTLNLTWDINSDITMIGNSGGYNAYVNGIKNNVSSITNNNYSVSGLNSGQIYLVQISSVDTDGNESNLCTGINATAN